MKKRIEWIDIARGIAIIAVVVGHTLGPYNGKFIGSWIFAFHMPIFFILSGYLYKQRSVGREFLNGIKNLLIPYFATVMIIFLINFVALKVPHGLGIQAYFPSARAAIISALYGAGSNVFGPLGWQIQPIGALWFLLAMFIAIQLFNLIVVMTNSFRRAEYIRFVICLVLVVIGGILGKIIFLPWAINAALFSVGFIYVGFLIQKYGLLTKISDPTYILWSGLWLISASFGYFNLNVPNSPNLVISFLGGIGGSLCVFRISQYLVKYEECRWFKLLKTYGRLSLIVLCFHLIDLNVISVAGHLYQIVLPHAGFLIAVVIEIIYRLVFVTIFVFLVPKTAGLRNCYLIRQFPIFKRKSVLS